MMVGTVEGRAERLKEVITSGDRLVIYLHDNPDPDTIASGWMLARLAEQFGTLSKIVYGGHLGRAENRTMVRLLRIPLHLLKRPPRPLNRDRYALVDTRPGAGNNSFPGDRRANIVIDHHPDPTPIDADFIDIFEDLGSCAARVYQYYVALDGKLDGALATAIVYALISETQDLGREAGQGDIQAYHEVLPKARLPVLGQIRHPNRDREYYRTIARAMQAVQVGRHTCVCHIGAVPYAEVVGEVADFLVAMERVTWCLVTGDTGKATSLSIRSTQQRARAERVMKSILRGLGRGGGHGAIAGGAIPHTAGNEYESNAALLTERFLSMLPSRKPDRLSSLV